MTRIGRLRLPLALAAIAVAALQAASGPAHAEDRGIRFESEEARFSGEMPKEPRQTLKTTDSFVGEVTNYLFTAVDGERHFTVDYSRIPALAIDFAGADTIYDEAKSALMKQSWSRVISFTDITTGGHAGKRLVYQAPPDPGNPKRYGEAHFFVVDDRLYVVDATVPAGDAEADAKRFLSSIRLL
jgi:hypothetical protein